MLAGFHWILPKSLAGSGQPGLLGDFAEDMAFLRRQGLRRVVSLTEQPLRGASDWGFDCWHFPIVDMSAPTPRACAMLCHELISDMHATPVLIHCRAGLGRTGTIAAACLITLGHTAEQALARVRGICPLYVQSDAQARFLDHYADWLAAEIGDV